MSKKNQTKFRHQNGFGSIVKLNGNRRKPYGVRVTTGWKDGKQIRKYVGYYSTQREALIALAEYHKGGYDLDLTKLTLKEVFDKWLDDRVQRNASDASLRTYKMTYSRLGKLGDAPMKQIKTTHLQKWFDEINLKVGSKSKIKSTLGMVFDYAAQNDIVTKNYAKFLQLEGETEKTGKVYTDDEIKLLWKHSNDENARILLILMYTGMRIGELLSITRDAIHFDERYMVGGSKTEAGKNRVIPIHDKVLPLVKEQLGDNRWLVQSFHGGKIQYSVIGSRVTKFLTSVGMEHKFHDTRKTAISLMHSANIPLETIKIIVGHAGADVTTKVYLYKNINELVNTINKVHIPY